MSSDPEKPDPAAPTPVEGEDHPKKIEVPADIADVPSDAAPTTEASAARPTEALPSDAPPPAGASDAAPSDAPSAPRAADESGSIDVAMSGRTPAVSGPIDGDHSPEASGSIDVALSGRNPAASEPSDAPPSSRRARRESASIDSDRSPEASGSIDVALSGRNPAPSGPTDAPRAAEESGIDVALSGRNPALSGSFDVAVSSTSLPRVDEDGAPVAIVDPSSAPVSSGAVRAVAARESTGRTKRLTDAAKEATKSAVSGGVTALGTGLGTIGEGVSKLGEKSKNVPLVGSSVSALGESLSSVGESLTELPRVAGTRRGRLLVRSLIVGFVLVFAWIVVIVALQLRGGTSEQIDFRPYAEKILIELSSGPEHIAQVYESASPRFLEFVNKEQFIDDMVDLNETVGKFKEISAVNDTLVTRGPTGRVGRVSLTLTYEKGKTKASVSLHQHEGVWKLLGIGVEVPPEVQITQSKREERLVPEGCKDPMDPKKCDLYVAANTILEHLRDNESAQIWDAASLIFQKQEEKTRWGQIQRENQMQLGEYRRIIAVTEALVYRSGNAVYDILVEYARSQGVRVIFGFTRASKNDPWKLISLKTVVPMPRFDEGEPPKSLGASPTGNPPLPEEPPVDAGVGSAKPAGSASPPKPKPVPKPKPGSGSATEGSGSAAGSGSAKLDVKIEPPKVEGTAGSAKVDVKVGSGSN